MKLSKRILCLILLVSVCLTAACAKNGTRQETPSASPDTTQSPAMESSPTQSVTATPTQEATEQPSQSPTQTPTGTVAPTDKKIIALSFDDGPDFDTPGLLDVLDKHGVQATFFIKGGNLEYAPYHDILKRTAQSGHELANHSYTHPDLRTLTDEEFLLELSKTNNKIYELTGQMPVLFRPPSGHFTEHQLSISPMPFVLWLIDSWDWYRISPKPVAAYATEHNCTEEEAIDAISDQILFEHGLGYLDAPAGPLTERLEHGAIFLFHDVHPGTAVLVDKLITYIEQTGEYTIMTVSDMMAALGTGPTQGKVYRSAWPKN